ncbi:hypothetical protein [Amycolatopsis vastitatis]|uniref:MucB/RseB N-terminal domain-containing protein n=1 Tax=Amycolatopsis vastitatis TaxID=1905142 RepID=A0A229T034_9PSEU|nr:hypothetical protein [Amycolatopsis vastitatis]OXM64234.1 hypothetical protein CF165_28290 [Amycolatopsis vastitatis]
MPENTEVLRSALRESVTDVAATPEVLLPALRKRYTRRVIARRAGLAATPLVVAAAVAGSVALVPGSGHSVPASGTTVATPVLDVAYVTAKVTSALDNAGRDVMYLKADPRKVGEHTVDESWVAADGSAMRQRLTRGGEVITDEQFTPAGILVVQHTLKRYYRIPDHGSAVTTPDGYSRAGVPLPGEIKKAVGAGALTLVGNEVIDGKPTIHLRLSGSGTVPGFVKDAFSDLWVSQSSYLPVRIGSGESRQDYSWLPPTPENLALLTAPIPAGYTGP